MEKFRLMPKTDAYFARTFMKYFLLCFVSLLALVVVGDLFQRGDEFAYFSKKSEYGNWAVIYIIIQYYLVYAPQLVLRFMLPLVMLLAAVITVTSSLVHNEYTVLRSAGISMQRALLPVLVPAFLIGMGIHLTRDLYLPFLVGKSHEISTTIRPRNARPLSLVVRDGKELQSISMGHFDDDGYAHNLRIEVRDLEKLQQGQDSFQAYTAHAAALRPRGMIDVPEGDTRELQWMPTASPRLVKYGRYARFETTWEEPIPTVITPAMLERQVLGEAIMTWDDLTKLADDEIDVRLEMHRRRAAPWAGMLLSLLGIVVALKQALRGGQSDYIKNIVKAILLCAGYYILNETFVSFGQSETLGPLLAVWMPVFIIGGFGGYIYKHLGW
jgi:lipopolysaccharide export LptBFGC system permease protein LptF